jgi:protein-S-isoprenylcysteine O-methyltransferase Ste14
MPTEEIFLRRAVVFGAALIYWGGVLVQARRVRKRIGRSPNLQPRGLKERLLWMGWLLIIVAWMAQPFLTGSSTSSFWLRFIEGAIHPATLALGVVTIAAGYAGTLWCYAAMGDAWRIGINRKERSALVTRGPFRFVRHPIYTCQFVMLAGTALLLPTPISLAVLTVHLLCVMAKASDEESYLETVHGQHYRDYAARTGGCSEVGQTILRSK